MLILLDTCSFKENSTNIAFDYYGPSKVYIKNQFMVIKFVQTFEDEIIQMKFFVLFYFSCNQFSKDL